MPVTAAGPKLLWRASWLPGGQSRRIELRKKYAGHNNLYESVVLLCVLLKLGVELGCSYHLLDLL
jgi:hypothetical protein